MGSQTTDSLESQNSVVGAQERRKGEGLWARPRVKTGPRSASDATAFFNSHKKTLLYAQLRGRRPWETSDQAVLSHVNCETFTDYEDSSGSRFQQYPYILFYWRRRVDWQIVTAFQSSIPLTTSGSNSPRRHRLTNQHSLISQNTLILLYVAINYLGALVNSFLYLSGSDFKPPAQTA